MALLQETLPALHAYEVLYRLYPYSIFLPKEGKRSVEELLATFNLETNKGKSSASIDDITVIPQDQAAEVNINYNGQQGNFQVSLF